MKKIFLIMCEEGARPVSATTYKTVVYRHYAKFCKEFGQKMMPRKNLYEILGINAQIMIKHDTDPEVCFLVYIFENEEVD